MELGTCWEPVHARQQPLNPGFEPGRQSHTRNWDTGRRITHRAMQAPLPTDVQVPNRPLLAHTGGDDGGSSQGSLFHLVDRTSTGFGSRLLRHWISHPLTQIHMIQRRQAAVAELVDAAAGEEPREPCVRVRCDERSLCGAAAVRGWAAGTSQCTCRLGVGRRPEVSYRGVVARGWVSWLAGCSTRSVCWSCAAGAWHVWASANAGRLCSSHRGPSGALARDSMCLPPSPGVWVTGTVC